MAANLPSLPPTVNFGGTAAGVQGDPLEYMRKQAREHIEIVNKNLITKENEKVEFKKYVLRKLKENIAKFEEIDKKYTEKKADEQEEKEEDDPFAGIFGSDTSKPDEATQEKMKIAGEFESHLKLYRTEYLKKVRIRREKEAKKEEEAKMEQILSKLENV